MLLWLESTLLARAVGESVLTTASLSALHLIGFTLVMSAGVVASGRAAGLLLRRVPMSVVARPARRMLLTGLPISVITGLALFVPRASYMAAGIFFRTKMVLLLLAVIYALVFLAKVSRHNQPAPSWLRPAGAIGVLLWLALAVTACIFILFE